MFAATRCGVMTSKGAPADPYLAYVSLLMHMENAFSNTVSPSDTFTAQGATPSFAGGASAKFGSYGMVCSASNNGIRLSSNTAAFTAGAGDFCIEAFFKVVTISGSTYGAIYATGAGASDIIISCGSGGLGGTDNKLNAWCGGTLLLSTTTVANSAWHHFALTRSGSTMRLFIDGVQEDSDTKSTNFNNFNTGYAGIGNSYHYAEPGSCFDEFRITKGVPRYTSNFTVPSAAF